MSTGSNAVHKGIILAGGSGTRLYPLTEVASKQLLPVYDKPMIYYPLTTLIQGGIGDILLISTPHDLPRFQDLLGDGSQYGVKLSYAQQPKPEGIAQAFLIGRDFIAAEPVCLILGDNILYGDIDEFQEALSRTEGATIFGYPVRNPGRYGVVEADARGNVISIEEKPAKPKSHLAVPGLYVYDGKVVELTAGLTPSARGELEITDLNLAYLARNELRMFRFNRGVAWLAAGTFDALLAASNFVATIEQRQSMKVGCPEEAALQTGLLSLEAFREKLEVMQPTDYRAYLQAVADEFDRS